MKHKLISTLSALALALAAAGSAQAVTLDTLIQPGGGSITAGDKLINNWTVSYFDSGDGRTFNAASINITPLNDGGMNPGPGLNFSVLNGALDVTGDSVYNYVDLTIGFQVSVLTPGLLIDDVTLNSLVGSLALTGDGSDDLGFYIHESIGTAAGLDDLGFLAVEFSDLNGAGTSATSALASFAPQSDVWVTKNILVWSTDTYDTASLTGFTQRFSQTADIPEPATMALVGLGLLGLGFSRKSKTA